MNNEEHVALMRWDKSKVATVLSSWVDVTAACTLLISWTSQQVRHGDVPSDGVVEALLEMVPDVALHYLICSSYGYTHSTMLQYSQYKTDNIWWQNC